MPPIAELQFAPTFALTSPGRILGSIHMLDDDGLDSVKVSVRSADSVLVGDSVFFLPFSAEVTLPINWIVPAGIATGTTVTIIAGVTDFAGFFTADTVQLAVQDSTVTIR